MATRKYNQEYYLQNKEEIKRKSNLYYKINKEKRLLYAKEKYKNEVGIYKNNMSRSDEEKRRRLCVNQQSRAKRARQARRNDELTKFVTQEAHRLRFLRRDKTNIDWHVDHIIPLKGKFVSGLHVWNNIQVIPAVENMRKNNRCL